MSSRSRRVRPPRANASGPSLTTPAPAPTPAEPIPCAQPSCDLDGARALRSELRARVCASQRCHASSAANLEVATRTATRSARRAFLNARRSAAITCRAAINFHRAVSTLRRLCSSARSQRSSSNARPTRTLQFVARLPHEAFSAMHARPRHQRQGREPPPSIEPTQS